MNLAARLATVFSVFALVGFASVGTGCAVEEVDGEEDDTEELGETSSAVKACNSGVDLEKAYCRAKACGLSATKQGGPRVGGLGDPAELTCWKKKVKGLKVRFEDDGCGAKNCGAYVYPR